MPIIVKNLKCSTSKITRDIKLLNKLIYPSEREIAIIESNKSPTVALLHE